MYVAILKRFRKTAVFRIIRFASVVANKSILREIIKKKIEIGDFDMFTIK